MATAILPGERAAAPPPTSSALYRAVWRWHFYAGLLVLPFMLLLAVTGALYLLKDEINDALYGHLRLVEARPGATLPASDLLARATAAVPGEAVAYLPPATSSRSAEVKVATAEGKRAVFLDPYTGSVLGDTADGGAANSPAMLLVRKLHSLDYFGWFASRFVELAAGWAMILVVTGFYLWWPRGRARLGGVATVRGAAGGRTTWRDLHAVTGAYAGLVIFFLALTGMPWSGFWGSHYQGIIDQAGLGMPPGYWDGYPASTVPMAEAMDRTPWVLEQAPMPASAEVPDGAAASVGVDQAVRTVEALGIHPGYALDLPDGPTGVYTASVYPDDIGRERVIHLDRYSGAVLFDVGFADLGPVGKAAEWGISVHTGQEFGRANQVLLLMACAAIVLMSVSAAVIWWKRRPVGELGAPRLPPNARAPKAVLAVIAFFGVLFPLVGLSILVALALDLALPWVWRERLA